MNEPAPFPAPANTKRTAPTWRRRLPLFAGLALVAAIVVGLWPRPVAVEIGQVTRGPMTVTVDEQGMTREIHRYVVSAPVAGQLERIDWKAGAPVVAGKTVLATLESSGADFLDARALAQAEAAVRAAEASREAAGAQRDRANAAAKLAAAEFERAKRLRDQGVASVQEFDTAEMQNEAAAQDARAAEFAVKVANFELQQSRAALMRGQPGGAALPPLVITSPIDGQILRVFQESARVVPAGFPLMELGDPTDLEVRIEVLSRDAVTVRPGDLVYLDQWGGDYPLRARVRVVEPSGFTKISALGVEEQRVYVVADFIDPIAKRPTLGDSYRVEARIVTWQKNDVLQAPSGALFQRGDHWQTFVVDGSHARLRTVKVGRTNGVQTEILGGLEPGDRLVVYPGDQVVDGTRVSALQIDAR
ncbi:MAG TPA: HlyD family efflux transporter periplasmic adaptor subunit [Opitutaceae bacterium]|nr:HlyD family efflux transporter periplasmic adaptor subunit [Opitutaceae bacterium]